MGNEDSSLRTNELVNFLAAHDATALAALSEQFPSAANELTPGQALGSSDAPMQMRIGLAIATLKKLVPIAQNLLAIAEKRIKRSNFIDFASQLIALVGSSGVLAFYASEKIGGVLVTGLIAFAGSATALFVKWSRRDFGGNEDGLVKAYFEASEHVWTATTLIDELVIVQRDDSYSGTATEAVVARANDLAGKLNRKLQDLR